MSFDEDRCRLRKDHSARNFAMIRSIDLNMLNKHPLNDPIRRKRFKAPMSAESRAQLMSFLRFIIVP